jgi:hypothetical protein
MRCAIPRSLAFLLALLLEPSLAQGQVQPLHRLPLETKVRLELAGDEVLRGRLARRDSITLTLRRINRDRGHRPFLEHRLVALDSIVRGWRYGGNHWKIGTVVGAVVGTAGMAVFASRAASDDGGACDARCWLFAAGFGIAIGGGIGYLVGHAVPVWQPVDIAPWPQPGPP